MDLPRPVLQNFGQEAIALAGLAARDHRIEIGLIGIDDVTPGPLQFGRASL